MKKIIYEIKEKWAEYLLEIVVIIIGILAAFLLNSWNANRKMEDEQARLMVSLHEEFAANLQSLDGQMVRLQRKIRACNDIALNLHPTNPPIGRIDVDTLIKRLYDVPTWNPSTYVLTELKSTGQLKSLENERLKKLLYEWEQHYENLKEWYELEKDLYARLFTIITDEGSARNALFKSHFKSSPFLSDNSQLFQSSKFENELMHTMMITGGLHDIYRNQTVGLIQQIMKETESP